MDLAVLGDEWQLVRGNHSFRQPSAPGIPIPSAVHVELASNGAIISTFFAALAVAAGIIAVQKASEANRNAELAK